MAKFRHVRYMNWYGGNQTHPCLIGEEHLTYADDYQVPLSVIAKVCLECGHDLYVNLHHKTTVDDFTANIMPILDGLIASGRKVYIEHSNEVWNGIFPQEEYGRQQAAAMGYTGNSYFGSTWFNGYRTAVLAKASRGKGYRWLTGVQTVQQSALSAVLFDGMDTVSGRLDSDIWGYHVSTYASGSLTLDDKTALATAQKQWATNRNFDAAFDNCISYDGPVAGAESYSIDTAQRTSWAAAKQIADAHGWKLVGYEGNFHLNAVPYSGDPGLFSPFFLDMIDHPLAGPATTYCLEGAEAAGFEFVTMFDWDSEPSNSNFGRFGMFGHPGYDAVTAWNANLAPVTEVTPTPTPAPTPPSPPPPAGRQMRYSRITVYDAADPDNRGFQVRARELSITLADDSVVRPTWSGPDASRADHTAIAPIAILSDNDTSAHWESNIYEANPTVLTSDLGAVKSVKSLNYTSQQANQSPGRWTYEISTDGVAWITVFDFNDADAASWQTDGTRSITIPAN